MADVHDDEYDDELFDDLYTQDEAAVRVGKKVIEMADRITDVALACPGSEAKWKFEIDGRAYQVVVTLVE